MLQQAHIEGRHAHHGCRAGHQPEDLVRVELRQEDHRCTGEQRYVAGHEQAVGVVDRQGMDEHVVRGEAPDILQGQCVRDEIVVRQHRSLGAARRARGIEDRSQIVSRPLHGLEGFRRIFGGIGQRSLTSCVQRFHGTTDLRGDRRDPFALAWITDDQLRLGVADEVLQLGERVGCIQGEIHGAGPHGCKIQNHGLNRLLDLHSDAVARLHPSGDQHVRKAAGPCDEVAIADASRRQGS